MYVVPPMTNQPHDQHRIGQLKPTKLCTQWVTEPKYALPLLIIPIITTGTDHCHLPITTLAPLNCETHCLVWELLYKCKYVWYYYIHVFSRWTVTVSVATALPTPGQLVILSADQLPRNFFYNEKLALPHKYFTDMTPTTFMVHNSELIPVTSMQCHGWLCRNVTPYDGAFDLTK